MSCTHRPVYNNECSASIGSEMQIIGYCAEYSGNPCAEIQPDEWVFSTTLPCDPNCGSDAVGVRCRRVAFTANPTECCAEDSANGFGQCIINGRTCDPIYRDILGGRCQQLFTQVCVDNSTDTEFTNAWTKDAFCTKSVARWSRSGQPNLDWIREQMAQVFRNYFRSSETQGGIAPIGSSGQFQSILYGVCKAFPAACSTGLYETCLYYNRSSALGNTEIANFCGCHMPSQVYAQYTDLYGIQKECDPLCARTNTIPTTQVNGIPVICTSSQCIIDNVTISLVDSTSGSFNFSQACGGCTAGSQCNCIISDVSIEVIESELGNVSLEQYCTGTTSCYATGYDGTLAPAKCFADQELPLTPEQEAELREQQEQIRRQQLFLILFLVLIIIVSIGMFVLFTLIGYRKTPQMEVNYIVEQV